jgi:hypothetical protein
MLGSTQLMSAPSEPVAADSAADSAAGDHSALDGQLASLQTLQDVITWGFACTPPCEIVDIVVQDEYCHDVVMRGPVQGAIQRYLCFDTT